jgi:hypothetical protein
MQRFKLTVQAISHSFNRFILMGLALFCLSISSVQATVLPASSVDWGNTFALQTSGGPVNPLVLVGFNPQPEPPIGHGSVLDFGNTSGTSSEPTVTANGTFDSDQLFQILFAMDGPGISFSNTAGIPDNSGHFEFSALDAAGAMLFNIMFDVTTSSNGVPNGDWVGFNPQPEPPIYLPGQGAAIGFNTGFTSFSAVTLKLQIQDAQGNALNFSEAPAVVPVPAAVWLFATALMGLVGYSKSKSRMPL